MPIDPNSETSDIGQMYRQYIQSKGMPLTQGNLQSVIAQSQREPGMIAGLSVEKPQMTAPTPMNIAGASPSSSGNALPIPPMPPTGIPQSAPIPQQAQQSLPNAPFPAPMNTAPSMAPQGAPPPTPEQAPPATPPPGQAPAPDQVPPSPVEPSSGGIESTLAALGLPAAAILGLKRMFGGGSAPPSVPPVVAPQAAPTPSVVNPASVAAAVNKGAPVNGTTIAPEVKPPAAPSSGPLVGQSVPSSPSSPVAAAIEKSVPTIPHENTDAGKPRTSEGAVMEAPYEPAYVRRGMGQTPQGPVTAPPRNSNPYPVDDGMSIPRVRPDPEIPASLSRQTSEQQFVKGVKPVGPPQSPVAAAMEKSVPPIMLKGDGRNPAVPEYLNRQRNSREELRGVKPIGPEIQGPPMGPGAVQGPRELTTVREAPRQIVPELPGMGEPMTATSPIGNILHDKPPIEMLNGIPKGMEIKPRVRVRGVRLP